MTDSTEKRLRDAERAVARGDESARDRLLQERNRAGDAGGGAPGGFTMLPAPPGTCPECAVAHEPGQAHNKQSLVYLYGFRARHGRWPTWRDAIAHCDPETRAAWERELRKLGGWDGDETPEVEEVPTGRIGSVQVVRMEPEKRRRRRRS